MLSGLLQSHQPLFHPVVPFAEGSDRVVALNLSGTNQELDAAIFGDTDVFSAYIDQLLGAANARYGIGGYLENRQVYARSRVFDAQATDAEPRTLHLGIDIWGQAGTPVMAPLDGIVHSTGYHDAYGNYGATVLLVHHLEGVRFYTLYGHLSKADLCLHEGDAIAAGRVFAHFGQPHENGHWPPHLHFQVMAGLDGNKGDYPGVCALSQQAKYEANCSNPDLILNLFRFAASL